MVGWLDGDGTRRAGTTDVRRPTPRHPDDQGALGRLYSPSADRQVPGIMGVRKVNGAAEAGALSPHEDPCVWGEAVFTATPRLNGAAWALHLSE